MNTLLKKNLAVSDLFRSAMSFLFVTVLISLTACGDGESLSRNADMGKAIDMMVYKSPTCRCCSKWVDHIEAAGFSVQVKNLSNLKPIKSRYGIEHRLRSCHTAIAEGFVFEGHIPAHTIRNFLAEKPKDSIGLAVPGMPVGSPGMEMGDRKEKYVVLLLKRNGSPEVYEHIGIDEKSQD